MVFVVFLAFLMNLMVNQTRVYGKEFLYRYQPIHTIDTQVSASNSYICQVRGCGARFWQKCNLVDHMRTHTNDRPFECTELNCDESFTTSRSRNRHMFVHGIGERYQCSWNGCERSFTQKCNQTRHEKNVHKV